MIDSKTKKKKFIKIIDNIAITKKSDEMKNVNNWDAKNVYDTTIGKSLNHANVYYVYSQLIRIEILDKYWSVIVICVFLFYFSFFLCNFNKDMLFLALMIIHIHSWLLIFHKLIVFFLSSSHLFVRNHKKCQNKKKKTYWTESFKIMCVYKNSKDL